MKKTSVLLVSGMICLTGFSQQAEERNNQAASVNREYTVQIPVSGIFNTRPVTTFANNKLYTWTVGIDGNGMSDGYLTRSASLFSGDQNPNALPDSAVFPANKRHPEVVLHYSNADSIHNQALYVRGNGDFSISLPPAVYTKLFLFFTSSEGASPVQIQLVYSDSSETLSLEIPDYYLDIPENDPYFFQLISGLAKWNKMNKMAEADHHNIDGLELHPSQTKALIAVKVSKGEQGYLVFWGATGVSNSQVR